ncbi:Rne/Rng family ribonuclease [Neobacillus sp. MM2021_6]|uniref:Rne/Rng family ribonuclease n=1 Tax=Bacillaceae TaxID=186817 RepID=UPI001407B3A8|nr:MULTISPECIES: Rne/Rng family ribonuclease [Bacillaceae]MBO0960728.1 Rne/Rng family ribonuclease [Neobacillus sp. MM2021_6]NHC17350.1 Rne/Rng family ribonuclease [Bacillus sp. MM2020_4]
METLIINYTAREKRFAYLRDNRVENIAFDRPEQRSLVGNIYFGTVTKVLPGMNAVFIDIAEEKNAYLHRDNLPSYILASDKQKSVTSFVHQGEKMLVQVDKDATGTKGPKVTGIIEIQGNHLIYMPKGRYIAVSKKIADESKQATLRRLGSRLKTEEEGIIFRTSSMTSTEEEIQEELQTLRQEYQKLLQKNAKKPGLIFQKDTFIEMILAQATSMKSGEVIVDDLAVKKMLEQANNQVKYTYYNGKENIFSANNVEHEIDKALKRIVWLDQGAYLIFDETEALTIIDVNTGKFSGKFDYQDTVLKTNQLAAKEIIRQLKLRDIGGIVLIDFIDMKRELDKDRILGTIETELTKDEKRTKVIGFTPLGILQITRKRTKVALSEALQTKCPVCEGTGRILSVETIAFRLERELLEHRHAEFEAILIETSKEVKEALLGENDAQKQALEELLQIKLYFSIKPAAKPYFILKQFGNDRDISLKAIDTYL